MLKDKVVFITGSARGIGYGIARAALDAGARVAIGDLDEQTVFAARDTLLIESAAVDESVFATVVDVTDEPSVETALTATRAYLVSSMDWSITQESFVWEKISERV